MKQMKLMIVLAFITLYCNGYCQEIEQEKKIEESKETSIYTPEQEEYMEKWFEDNISKMNFSDEEKSEYNRVLLSYTSKMGQPNKNENNYSDKELKQELNKIVDKMNSEMKIMLTKEQYKMHVDNFKLILWNVYIRRGWKQ